MRKTVNIICGLVALLWAAAPLTVHADEVWCAVTDNNHIVALSDVSCLVSTPDTPIFNVILSDGSAITGVSGITFAMYHLDGVTDIEMSASTVIDITADMIVISQAQPGARLTISAVDGRCLLSSVISTDPQPIDISSLPPAVYILSVDGVPRHNAAGRDVNASAGKPIKFRKL